MAKSSPQAHFAKLLKSVDIKVNGKRPTDITVNNPAFYSRVVKHGSLGVGEAYMDGWWETDDLEEVAYRVAHINMYNEFGLNWASFKFMTKLVILNAQGRRRAYKNARHHYDIGNDLYEPMLGTTMAYSCGYWQRGAKTLDEAQEAKYQLICEKLMLKKDLTVLDIGAGWGGLARYMVKNYKVKVVALTPAKEQVQYMKTNESNGITPVCTTYQDYKPNKQFDRIVSVGMFEHVGPKNYKAFFKDCDTWLKQDGLFLLHTIGAGIPSKGNNPWIEKYIFPGGILPSVSQISSAAEPHFVIEDIQNFGPDYHRTLMAWYKNFKKAYPTLDHDKYDIRFYKMWEFYLLTCAAQFRARKIHLFQTVFTKSYLKTYVAAR